MPRPPLSPLRPRKLSLRAVWRNVRRSWLEVSCSVTGFIPAVQLPFDSANFILLRQRSTMNSIPSCVSCRTRAPREAGDCLIQLEPPLLQLGRRPAAINGISRSGNLRSRRVSRIRIIRVCSDGRGCFGAADQERSQCPDSCYCDRYFHKYVSIKFSTAEGLKPLNPEPM